MDEGLHVVREDASDPTSTDPDDVLAVDRVLLLDEVGGELQLPMWEPTGEPRVDAALDLLGRLDPDDVDAHAAVFDEVHQRLRGTLTDLDAPN